MQLTYFIVHWTLIHLSINKFLMMTKVTMKHNTVFMPTIITTIMTTMQTHTVWWEANSCVPPLLQPSFPTWTIQCTWPPLASDIFTDIKQDLATALLTKDDICNVLFFSAINDGPLGADFLPLHRAGVRCFTTPQGSGGGPIKHVWHQNSGIFAIINFSQLLHSCTPLNSIEHSDIIHSVSMAILNHQ